MTAKKGSTDLAKESAARTMEKFKNRSKKTEPEAAEPSQSKQDEVKTLKTDLKTAKSRPKPLEGIKVPPLSEIVSEDVLEAAKSLAEIESQQSRTLNAAARGLMSKKDNRSHRISIFVTEDRYKTLQDLKKSTGVSVNSLINSAIDQLIEDNREFLTEEIF